MLYSSSLPWSQYNPLKSTPKTPSEKFRQRINLTKASKLDLDQHKNCSRAEHVEHPSEEKFFEHCTNCAILPRPLSRDHFCENLASLLFHSSAGERLQYLLKSSHSFSINYLYPVLENICYPDVNTGSFVDILQLPSRLCYSTT